MNNIKKLIKDISEVIKLEKNNITYHTTKSTAYERRMAHYYWCQAQENLEETIRDRLPGLESDVHAIEELIEEMVEELLPHNTKHQKLIIKALRILGMTDHEIQLWLAGEILF